MKKLKFRVYDIYEVIDTRGNCFGMNEEVIPVQRHTFDDGLWWNSIKGNLDQTLMMHQVRPTGRKYLLQIK